MQLHRVRLTALAAIAAAAPATAAQEPGAESPVIARYTEADGAGVVSRDDLALELGRRFGRTQQGQAALEFMVDLALIRGAAAAQRVMPTAAETGQWIDDLEVRLKGAGVSLAQMMAQKGMSPKEFEEFAALQLAQERMVRRAMRLSGDEPVTADMLRLWLDEARGKQRVVTDAEQLPPGSVAKVGDRSLTALDLGRVLSRTLDLDVRQRYTRQIVLQRGIGAMAAARSIAVSSREMNDEVESRKREAEANPAYQGMSFDDLLQTQGTSTAELKRSPVVRAQLQERKLVQLLLPDAEIERRLRSDRDAVLRQHGARRRLQILLVHPSQRGGDRAAALATARQIKAQIDGGLPFADAARTHSDDPYSKVSGGDVGWHHRASKKLPAAVVEAAFGGTAESVHGPVVTDNGIYLVRVAAIEPEPTDETLAFRMRQARSAELRREILERAALRFVDGGGE